MKTCAIIPTHNHAAVLADIVERLRREGTPVVVVDDGSAEPAASAIAKLNDEARDITVLRLDINQGKGAAFVKGLELAFKRGFTHAVQIDADGQHDLNDLPALLEASAKYPEALITGCPTYDVSMPLGRRLGRWVTHVWVWIETLSFKIRDSMCGFRVYPLEPVKRLLANAKLGTHMDFDTEIMVRLFWLGVDVIPVAVHVTYPKGNTSNFDIWRDNWRISAMHTRLFFTMIWRALSALLRTSSRTHWSGLAERGGYWGVRFCAGAYGLLGYESAKIVLAPIVLYFFMTGAEQRKASEQFLHRALRRAPTLMEVFRHQMNFALKALDTLAGWGGGITSDQIDVRNSQEVAQIMNSGRGGVIVVAHLGNAEIARVSLDKQLRDRLTILVHTRHARNYNRILSRTCPDAAVRLLEVTEIGPETIIDIQQRTERGEWIVIAGDRTPVLSRGRCAEALFFGQPAPFPQGPWLLASILQCPVYLLFCLRQGKRYRLTVEHFAEQIKLERKSRQADLDAYVASYAARLEFYASREPFQWYNFFDFWAASP